MKQLFISLVVCTIAWSCTTSQKDITTKNNTLVKSDSTEYEITIIDPGFDQWYMMRYSPANDMSNEIYKIKNLFAVSNWNDYFNRGKYSRVINSYIHYNSFTDYGIDVNRKLYWYFVYIEETSRISLFK